MIDIIEIIKDEEYIIGTLPDKLTIRLEKHGAPDSFKSIHEAIKCLRKNGNKDDINVISSDSCRVYDYMGVFKYKPERNTINIDDAIESEKNTDNTTKSCIGQYFNYQKELNELTDKINKIKNLQEQLKDDLKTEIATVLLAYDINKSTIVLDDNELKIGLPVEVDEDIINTVVFTKLNELIGMEAKLTVKVDSTYRLELLYELK